MLPISVKQTLLLRIGPVKIELVVVGYSKAVDGRMAFRESWLMNPDPPDLIHELYMQP